jgi:hypothetical protein
MSDIFISHVEENSELATEIAEGLEASGYSTWYYERDSLPGPSYLLQTSREIERSQAVVLIISPHSLSSHQVTKEVIRAHESDKPFVPVLKSITHVEFANRQPEWREAVGSATSISVPREGASVILPRILQGLKGMGIEATGEATAGVSGEYRGQVSKRKKPLFKVGSLKVFPITALIAAVLLAALTTGGIVLASRGSKEPGSVGQSPSATEPVGTIPQADITSPVPAAEEALDAATTDLNTSLGALRVSSAQLTTEACPPPGIPERCKETSGSNRYLILILQGSGGGDIGLTTQFTTEAHASTVSYESRRYGASSVFYDDGSGRVEVVYGVLPEQAVAGPVLLHWQENPTLRLTLTA